LMRNQIKDLNMNNVDKPMEWTWLHC
jgi:hypothetical protein